MDNNNNLWDNCLAKMRQYVKPHIFDTWFKPITCEQYDPEANTLLLRLPSKYIREYIEEYHLQMLTWALNDTYKPGVTLQYRIPQNTDGNDIYYTLDAATSRTYLKVPEAADRMRTELSKHITGRMQWLPAYDRIARWLTDNKGRGLLCVGTTGLGKSLICQRVLPALLQQPGIVQCHADDMARRIDELLKARCVIIDDLGKEKEWYFKDRNNSFSRLCTEAERRGTLLIITTNLSTTPVDDPRYPDSIEHRYGPEVTSRLRSLILAVEFVSPDLRF